MYYTLALRAAWWICCGQWLTSGAPRPRAKKVPFCPTERHNDEKGNPLGKLGVSSVHVFISYSHANGDFAEILRTRLEGSGFNVWTDEDRLLAGEDWRNGIDKAIRSACALIVVMTPSAKASEYVTYEWAFAWGVGVKVIPILLEPTPLHPRLEVLQYLDFSIRSARPWDKLLALLKEVSANSRAVLLRGQDDLVSSISGIVRNALSNLDNVDRDIRQKAVEMLASMQDPVARDAVVSALKHPIRDVREAAARALVEIKYPAAVPALIEALRDEDSNVRRQTAQARGDQGPGGSTAPNRGPARQRQRRARGGDAGAREDQEMNRLTGVLCVMFSRRICGRCASRIKAHSGKQDFAKSPTELISIRAQACETEVKARSPSLFAAISPDRAVPNRSVALCAW